MQLDMPIGNVTIKSDESENSLGHIEVKTPQWLNPEKELSARALSWIERRIQVALAGRAAEKLFTGRWNHVGARSDYETAVSLACYRCASSDETTAFLKWLDLKTRQLVASQHVQIDGVAHALLQLTILRPKEVKRAVYLAVTEAMRKVR